MSTVTAVLPRRYARAVIDAVTREPESSAFVWDARGTLLHEQWFKQLLPSISPVKTVLRLLVPDHDVDRVVGTIVREGRLDLQAAGAVYTIPCDDVYLGPEFHRWPVDHGSGVPDASHGLRENLDVIHCIVEPTRTETVARAAIRAGAHGPIVYFSEGKGLRDRLGWLRITKQPVKEVVTVIAEAADADEIFTAMVKAGQLHLPGRGFIYRMPVEKGLFNLPSRVAHHHYAANMQQIIHAIDRLAGHTHWRDQSVFDVGGDGRGAGLSFLVESAEPADVDHVCVQGIVRRSELEPLVERLRRAGVSGSNVSHVRFAADDGAGPGTQTRLHLEYSLLHCVLEATRAEAVMGTVVEGAADAGILDLCLFRQPVTRVATYTAGQQRRPARA